MFVCESLKAEEKKHTHTHSIRMNSDFGIFVNENGKRMIDRKAPNVFECVSVCVCVSGVFDTVNDSKH